MGAACSGFNDYRGIGDAPVDQQPDTARKVWPNADRFPNIRAAADPLTTRESIDDYYRLGIDMIVGGIAAIAAAHEKAARGSGSTTP